MKLYRRKFIKTLGRQRQRKNLETVCIKYDIKDNALVYTFPPKLKIKYFKENFSNWCEEQKLEFNDECIKYLTSLCKVESKVE